MSKSVRRWIPVSLYEIAGIESWLSDLSAQGLALERFGLYFAYFRRTEPLSEAASWSIWITGSWFILP